MQRPRPVDELRVRMPVPLQILGATGDQALAANIDVFRATLVGTGQLDEETMHVLGALQVDASLMSPMQEDNYYLAAGILPWGGEVDSAIEVLQRATQARTFDALPPFFLGFTQQYFQGDYLSAAHSIDIAAARSSGTNRLGLQAMAARWYEKTPDPLQALSVLRAMAQQSRDQRFKRYLEARALRVDGLIQLKNAEREFRATVNQVPSNLDVLVGYGGLKALPIDPTGIGYILDKNGHPDFAGKRQQIKTMVNK
ncbi:hypothetical protein [Andreprevotia chitinilytica]|uniref:hypothetical protein n=1 Tax=Andreprevotia chitinilytica TaxID=396808 RepID=UPI0012EBE390|nr:hypothetical protein [Andreprevotia chitinilytica]